jgi:hypothetical protein
MTSVLISTGVSGRWKLDCGSGWAGSKPAVVSLYRVVAERVLNIWFAGPQAYFIAEGFPGWARVAEASHTVTMFTTRKYFTWGILLRRTVWRLKSTA